MSTELEKVVEVVDDVMKQYAVNGTASNEENQEIQMDGRFFCTAFLLRAQSDRRLVLSRRCPEGLVHDLQDGKKAGALRIVFLMVEPGLYM